MKGGRGKTVSRQGHYLSIGVCGLIRDNRDGPPIAEKSDAIKGGRGIRGIGAIEKFLQIRHPVAIEIARGIVGEIAKVSHLPGIRHAAAARESMSNDVATVLVTVPDPLTITIVVHTLVEAGHVCNQQKVCQVVAPARGVVPSKYHWNK